MCAACARRRSSVMADTYTPNEMMTIAAARALRNDDVCFVGIGMPSAAANLARLTHAPGHHADLRIRHHRHQAERAAALDRRRRIVRDRADHRLGAGDVPLLAARRPHHRRLPRRRADRQIRQSQHHRGRPLRQAEGAAAGRRRRAGDRHLLRRDLHHHGAGQAQLRRQARFRHLARPRRGRRHRARLGAEDQGPDQAGHRSVRLRARSADARK